MLVPPGWKSKRTQAISITDALTEKSGITVKLRIAKGYLQILQSFSSKDYGLVYVGSFVQSIIYA